jgi:hypothetical protein
MTAPAGCQLIGRWRIVEADLWDRGYLDLVEHATITIGADNHGEIAFCVPRAAFFNEHFRNHFRSGCGRQRCGMTASC